MDKNNFNYHDFLAFMLIYASDVNNEISDKEGLEIQKQIEIEEYEKVLEFYLKLVDFEKVEVIIENYYKFINNDDEKAELFSKIKSILLADNVIDDFEDQLISTFNFL